jgi:hypothetical protein
MLVLNRFTLVKRSRNILRTLGARSAAGFLRNRGCTLAEALVSLGMPVRSFE